METPRLRAPRVTEVRAFLAGEGAHELGAWANHPAYRPESGNPGVVEALLRRAARRRFVVEGAVVWRKIHKYKVGDHRSPEHRNVLGAALMAQEAGCDVLVFVRDRDGDESREREIDKALADVSRPSDVDVIGGVAIEQLEAWILALRGERRSEEHSRPDIALRERFGVSTGGEMVDVVAGAALDDVPADAHSLRGWLAAVARILG